MAIRSFHVSDPEGLDQVAEYVSAFLKSGMCVALRGSLGCGKTEWTRRFLRLKGVSRPVVSPTFTYYEAYSSEREPVTYYHFDLYRISAEDEFFMIGGEEIMDGDGNICIIEWPDVISGLLENSRTIRIDFEMSGESREVTVSIPDAVMSSACDASSDAPVV